MIASPQGGLWQRPLLRLISTDHLFNGKTGIPINRQEILVLQLRKFYADGRLILACAKLVKNIADADAHAADAWGTVHDRRIAGDSSQGVKHVVTRRR